MKKTMPKWLLIVLPFLRPYAVELLDKAIVKPDMAGSTQVALRAIIDFLDEYAAAYADGGLDKEEKKKLKAKANTLGQSFPGLVQDLPLKGQSGG
jgi:hypothetical protein